MNEQKQQHQAAEPKLRPQTLQKVDTLITRYPEPEAALIPVLHAVQDDLGYLPSAAIEWVAERLQLPHARVMGVVSFYSMLRTAPPGAIRLELCTNLSCSLMGAEHLREHLCRKLGIRPGETTADGRFTLSEVECLGSCGTAPVMLVNDEFHENLDPARIDTLIDELRRQPPRGNAGGDAP